MTKNRLGERLKGVRSMQRYLLILGLAAMVVAPVVMAGEGSDVGDAAPDFTLTDQDGQQITLSEVDGVRVLEWLNPDCPFVKRHYKAGTMKRLAAAYGEEGVTWLTINSTHYMDQSSNQEFAKAHGLGQHILSDESGEVGHLYKARTTPHMFVINAGGTIVYNGAIDDDPRGNKGDEATNHVSAALDELLAGKAVTVAETQPYGCSVKYSK
jgi:peroxiredoxin